MQEQFRAHRFQPQPSPQGAPLSPLFSHIYLSPFDHAFDARDGVEYFRYADDILLFCTERHAPLLLAEVERALHGLGLGLVAAKTSIRPVEDGFDFLGMTIRRDRDGRIEMAASSAAIDAFKRRLGAFVECHRDLHPEHLRDSVERKLACWAGYYADEEAIQDVWEHVDDVIGWRAEA